MFWATPVPMMSVPVTGNSAGAVASGAGPSRLTPLLLSDHGS